MGNTWIFPSETPLSVTEKSSFSCFHLMLNIKKKKHIYVSHGLKSLLKVKYRKECQSDEGG